MMMLRPVGMACENDMLEATGGVNTIAGPIFAFGLLSAAAGRLVSKGEPIEQHPALRPGGALLSRHGYAGVVFCWRGTAQ
ncbi:triphosphoribosyl-dephospho-CoA synthase [Klebsiella pneumoniae]|uniref:2-(5''-triphosphoribosyl)-3'-dephosphocoenzyme-A synthase n=1 Tax=Klebsiella pneumoniae TaxID=573 RepID=A0A377TMJ8_KLEPN|nr:triphosphoribosyl-dephospho-CoA synthase [Klebsiella pneumoniae]